MALPRSKYVQEGQEGVYHCYSRCVRRAFLCGYDPLTGKDFSHRKKMIVDRLKFLATIFAIEVWAYAIMENHMHNILRTRPDIVATWSDREVAIRWLTLYPQRHGMKHVPEPPQEDAIRTLTQNPERIAQLRRRLCSLSWFMARLNEFIARAANKEDNVKGRFWESRFKCQALLDDSAVAACMVYVDLNVIRAGLAATPEESDFTSVQERIRLWQKNMTASSEPLQPSSTIPSPDSAPENPGNPHLSDSWLAPISPDSEKHGILHMTELDYFDLVDKSGRMIRPDKRGSVPADMMPILLRIGARPETWIDTVSGFGSGFRLVAGRLSSMRNFSSQLGRKWFKGIASARTAFI
jgi:REP element-mobilizing transposase RayT